MELLKQNGPNCLLYSLAMILRIEPKEIEQMIGHDCSDVWWDDLPAPNCYRGMHTQECVDVAMTYGQALVLIQTLPVCAPNPTTEPRHIWTEEHCDSRIVGYLDRHDALMLGRKILATGKPVSHAVAWDHKTQQVFDPAGVKYDLTNPNFATKEIWLLK